jgi:hypothetical protein
MSVLDPKKTYKNLKSKGFVDSINKSKDHKWVDFFHNEKYVLSTKISHGNKDIDKHLIKQMAYQCKLEKNDFIDLVKCPLSKEDFIQILNQQGLLE